MSNAPPLDRAEIEASQLADLKQLLAEIRPNNAFYEQKLSTTEVDSKLGSLADFRSKTPFTVKQELVEDQLTHPPYGTNLTYPVDRYTRQWQTSGTTGQPMRWLDTPESLDWMLECWGGVYRSAGVTADDRIFFAFSFGPFLGFWTAFGAAERMGCLCLPGGGMSSSARLRAILESRISVLCCTPTYAIRLAEVAASAGINLAESSVRRIIVAGEPGGAIPATRELIEKLWPAARLVDHHGMTEIGPASYECPVEPGVLHMIETAFLTEVIDPQTGQGIEAGETGELVVTNLGRLGSPLLRYRTGDLVRPRAPGRCTCGSYELALQGGILGRVDDMVVVRGVNIFPSAVEDVVRSCGEIAEYCVERRTVNSLAELGIRIEPTSDCPDQDALAMRLEASLRDAFGLRIPVSTVAPGELPRFEMKANRWRDA